MPSARDLLEQADALMRNNRNVGTGQGNEKVPVLTDVAITGKHSRSGDDDIPILTNIVTEASPPMFDLTVPATAHRTIAGRFDITRLGSATMLPLSEMPPMPPIEETDSIIARRRHELEMAAPATVSPDTTMPQLPKWLEVHLPSDAPPAAGGDDRAGTAVHDHPSGDDEADGDAARTGHAASDADAVDGDGVQGARAPRDDDAADREGARPAHPARDDDAIDGERAQARPAHADEAIDHEGAHATGAGVEDVAAVTGPESAAQDASPARADHPNETDHRAQEAAQPDYRAADHDAGEATVQRPRPHEGSPAALRWQEDEDALPPAAPHSAEQMERSHWGWGASAQRSESRQPAVPHDSPGTLAAPPDEPVPEPRPVDLRELADTVYFQVLQNLDLYTERALQARLTTHLAPIIERASRELLSAINANLGGLIRQYVADAIEKQLNVRPPSEHDPVR